MNNYHLLAGILLIAIIGYKLIKNPLLRFMGMVVLIVFGSALKDYNVKSPTIGPTMVHDDGSPLQTSTSSSPSISRTNCSICGKSFTGDGYCEDIDGQWKPCTSAYSGSICSEQCGLIASERANKVEQSINNTQYSERCTNCHLGYYRNGFCDRCGAASKERVKQSRENLPDCPLCKGTGIERPMGANSSGESGRICPMCNGSGKTGY